LTEIGRGGGIVDSMAADGDEKGGEEGGGMLSQENGVELII
jgi:hypothetical protein